jgi:cell division protein FtsZ
MKDYVDALLVIHNDRLRDIYGDQKLSVAFGYADNVLAMAAKGIAEIITVHGYVNVDFADVRTVMERSGVAIMGSGIAEGENRAYEAISKALISPLLNNNNLKGARNILLNITSGKQEVLMDEITEIMDFIQHCTQIQSDIIWGNTYDESLGNALSVTIVATGLESEIGLGDLKPNFGHKTSSYKMEEEYQKSNPYAEELNPELVPLEVDGIERDGRANDPYSDRSAAKSNKKEKAPRQPRKPNVITKFMGSLFDDTDDKLE